jgi:gamma-glutamylcysteine synthetase
MARADLGDLGRTIERLDERGRLVRVRSEVDPGADLAKEMLDLADAGLTGRAEEDWFGQDERQFLTALRGIAESGRTPADEKLELFHGRWRGSVDPIFAEFAY